MKIIKEIFILLILLCMNFIFFYKVLEGQFTLLSPPDTSELTYPNYYFIADSLKHFIIPLWDPHLFAGLPLSGYSQYGLFYPINIFFWIFPYSDGIFPYYAYEYLVISHIFLAGWFMYLLGRGLCFDRVTSLCVGTMYMFNSNLIIFTAWGNQLAAFSWFPIVFLFTALSFFKYRQKIVYALLAGFFLGILILASPAQPAIMMLLLIGSLYLFIVIKNLNDFMGIKEISLNFIIIISTGLLISAITILPVLEFAKNSIRFLGPDGVLIGNNKMPFEAFTRYVIPHKNLLGFLLPDFARNIISSNFFGIIPLIFALAAIFYLFRNTLIVSFLTILFICSIAYSFGILLPHIFYYLPFVNKIREPERYLIYTSFVIPILAGYGLNYFISNNFSSKYKSNSGTKTIVSITLMLLLIFWIIIGKSFTLVYLQIIYIIVICILILQLLHSYSGKYILLTTKLILLILIFFELFYFSPHFLHKINFDVDTYFSSWNRLFFLKPEANSEIFRITSVESEKGWPYPNNAADIIGFYDTLGYGNPLLYKFFNYRNHVNFSGGYYDLLNVKYFITDDNSDYRINNDGKNIIKKKDILDVQHLDVTSPPYNKNHTIHVYENTNRLGPAWVVDKFTIVDNKIDLINKIEHGLDLRREVIVSKNTIKSGENDYFIPQYPELRSRIEITRYDPNFISLKVNSNKRALLVLSELYYPGWQVYINGKKQNVLAVNNILRGNFINYGENIVEYKYRPFSVFVGFLFMAITIIIILFHLCNEYIIKHRGIKKYLLYVTVSLFLLMLIFSYFFTKVA